MSINPNLIEIKKVTELPDLALALDNFFAHCKQNGVLGKVTIQNLMDYLAPYMAGLVSSGFVPVSGTVLPSPLQQSAFTLLGAGTYTQTTGGSITCSPDINIVGWNGTTWTVLKNIAINLTNYVQKNNVLKPLTGTIQSIVPDYLGQLGVVTDEVFNQTFYVARSLGAATKWELIYNYYELNKILTTTLTNYILKTGAYKVITLTTGQTVNDIPPDYRGQIGVNTADGIETFYIGRSTSAATKWERIYNERMAMKTLAPTSGQTIDDIIPDFKGQIGIVPGTGSDETLYIARSVSATVKWDKIYNDFELNKTLPLTYVKQSIVLKTLAPVSPATIQSIVPDYKGQLGVEIHPDFSETFYIARSLTAGIKWDKIYNEYELTIRLNSALANYVQKAAMLKTIDPANIQGTTPDFKGQIGIVVDPISMAETFYIARSTAAATKWTRIFDQTLYYKILAPVSPATIQDIVPDFRGQLGFFDQGSGQQTWYHARSLSAATKWDKIYNDYELNVKLTSYLPPLYVQKSNVLRDLVPVGSPATIQTIVPDYKGQLGVVTEAVTFNQTFYIARSTTSPTNKWEKIYNDYELNKANASSVTKDRFYGDSFVNFGKVISKYETEKYAHASYIEFVGDFGYVPYICNDVQNFEGGVNQLVRMTKFNVLDPQATRQSIEVGRGGQTYGDLTLEPGEAGVPNILKIDDNTLRVFFRGHVAGSQTSVYRDYNVATGTLGGGFIIQCKIKKEATLLPLNVPNAYAHYDWLRGSTDALQSVNKDMYITSDLRRFSDGKLYTCCSLGSGLDKNTASILMVSEDNGATFTLMASPDSLALPGVTNTDVKYFWEGAVVEDTDSIYIFARGAAAGPAKGVHHVKVPKSDMYTTSDFTFVWPTSNQKPCVISYLGIGTILFTEGAYPSAAFNPLNASRTTLDIIKISPDFTVFTKMFTAIDVDGIQTPSAVLKTDEIWVSFSCSKRRLPQTRGGVDYYLNTSEIGVTKLDRRYFL